MKKLRQRITKEFKKCTFIGDILINDEEYELLKKYLYASYKNIMTKASHTHIDPVFAVALVQIGIRYYDGGYWPHVNKEIGVEPLSGVQQRYIGDSFYKTLVKYNKYNLGASEKVNNILMHCFITENYANDLFDFLFMYYELDLGRDLERHKYLRPHLINSMKRSENSARAYKLKKHTSDAVIVNTRGCSIRATRILKLIDNALFNDILPLNSKNRVSQFFVKWAQNSPKFETSKKELSGLTRNGLKRYSSPYIKFNSNKKQFSIVLPPQNVYVEEDDNLNELYWKVIRDNDERIIRPEFRSSVTGVRTEEVSFVIPHYNIFDSYKIELIKDGIRINDRKIRRDSVRFFDDDGDMITYTDHIPSTQIYAFTDIADEIVSDTDIYCEHMLGMHVYSINLSKGHIIKLPDNRVLAVGKTLEEGLLASGAISGAYVIKNDVKYTMFNEIPSMYFKVRAGNEKGIKLTINNKPQRLNIENCIKFKPDGSDIENGYILKLSDFLNVDGVYSVILDIPNDRKVRDYSFTYISDFGFKFENAPYIFKTQGNLVFTKAYDFNHNPNIRWVGEKEYKFDIFADKDYLSFEMDLNGEPTKIHIYVPALKWKFDNDEWNIERPEEIWHEEFPTLIYIKHPDDYIRFSMPPLVGDEDDEDAEFFTDFVKDKNQHMFICDTRKMLSWFGKEEALRPLYIEFKDERKVFATIITRCFLNDCSMHEGKDDDLVFQYDILGFNDCVVDIFFNNTYLAKKVPVTTKGTHLKVPFLSGNYILTFYEVEEDEFGFGEDYYRFDQKILKYENKRDISGRNLTVQTIFENKAESIIFGPSRYELKSKLYISDIEILATDNIGFIGKLRFEKKQKNFLHVSISFVNNDVNKLSIKYHDYNDHKFKTFMYDKESKSLVSQTEERLSNPKRYILLEKEKYHFKREKA